MTSSFIVSSKCCTAGLQQYHVDEELPVINTKIDFPGPKYITDEREQELQKAYICLYTYDLTKALHLHVREGLDTIHSFVWTFLFKILITSITS